MDLVKLAGLLAAAEKAYERECGEVAALASRSSKATQLAEQAQTQADDYELAAKLLNQFSDQRQEQVIKIIEGITSQGLSQVFDEDISLTITQVVRARRVELDVKVRTGSLETSIMDARGGGLAAVAGFLLRASVVLLTPNVRPFLALDEVFAMLSEDYVPRMAEFLRELCEETGLQLMLVTHQPEFAEAAHKVYRIEKTGLNTSRFIEET